MNHSKKLAAFLIGLTIVSAIAGNVAFTFGTVDVVEVTVSKTEQVSVGSGKDLVHKYLVFTDGEVFENTDAAMFFKFNSSDIHGRLVPGRYRLKVYGVRYPLLSWYRNIVSIEEDLGS